MAHPVRAVLLDLGGVLLNEDAEYEAWDENMLQLLRAHGNHTDASTYHEALTAATRRCDPSPRTSALWTLVRPDLEKFVALKTQFRAFTGQVEDHLKLARVRPGAHDVVAALAARYELALAANQPSAVVGLLRDENLLSYFRWQRVSEDMGIAKPDPLFFRVILDAIGVPPDQAVMVGDRLDADVLPAKQVGMRTVRVLAGPYAEQLPPSPAHVPDRTIASLDDLPDTLEELNGG